jgi:hypothetical protein
MSLPFCLVRGALFLQALGNVVGGARMLLTLHASAETFGITNVEVSKMLGM